MTDLRSEYWYFMLIQIAIVIALGLIGGEALSFLYLVVTMLPSWAVTVRRLHDTDRSGWWALLAFLPVIGAIVLIVFLAQEGQSGPNQFGVNPEMAELSPST